MAGQNDFLIFDENQDNMLTQELYASDDDRTDGFKTGLARSNVTNKVLRQSSIMASAIGELVKTQGGQATDISLSNLVGSLKRLYSIKNYYSDATYAEDDIVISIIDDEVKLYRSLVDNNIGNQLSDTTKWESVELGGGSSRNIGEIVSSTIPLTDAGLHLLDGSLISGSGSYSAFVDYIADLYDSGDYTAIFDTEANWQSTVTSKGVCNKFVYDSINNTVRLPKYGASIYTKNPTISISTASTVPVSVYGTGKPLLFTSNGSNSFTIGRSTSNTIFYTQTNTTSNLPQSTSNVANLADAQQLGITKNTASGLTGSAKTSSVISSYSLTNYPLSCYYYIVIATTTKTDIEVDIDEIATDLNSKADITAVDGRWVFSNSQIAQSVTYPTSANTAYSLANYLPDDDYSYEVMLSGSITTGTGSSDYLHLTVSSDIITSGVFICGARTRTTYSVAGSGNAILPVGGERKIYINYNSGYTGTYNLYVKAYRRLGSNT